MCLTGAQCPARCSAGRYGLSFGGRVRADRSGTWCLHRDTAPPRNESASGNIFLRQYLSVIYPWLLKEN